MFEVGDKIFYPMHGACVIQSIEEKVILATKQLFIILEIPSLRLKIMLAEEKIGQLGVRRIESKDTIQEVLSTLDQGETDYNINSNLRYRTNFSKLKTGDIFQGAEVVRDLMRISLTKVLPLGDKAMLANARDYLISEIMLSMGVSEEQATLLLDDAIKV